MRSTSASVMQSGFSTKTCRPASSAARVTPACVAAGAEMTTASRPPASMRPSKSACTPDTAYRAAIASRTVALGSARAEISNRSDRSRRFCRCSACATIPQPMTPTRTRSPRLMRGLYAASTAGVPDGRRHVRMVVSSLAGGIVSRPCRLGERGGGMTDIDRPITRERLLRTGAAGAVGLTAAGRLAQRALAAETAGVTLNWLTWSDHYFPNQLQKVKGSTKIGGHVQLISDDADAYVKVKRGGSGWDISSEDALWVPKFYKEGLIEAFDIKSIPVSKQLYSVALHVPFWKAGSNQMGYPFGWSSLPIYYNPKHVKTKPTSYHALLDKKYKKKIVLENQPTDIMAMGGLATGAKQPYNMTTG